METETKKAGIVYESPILTWEAEKRFLIPNVAYRGKTGTYRLFEQMTPSMNQDALAELYEREKAKGNPYPTDAPLIWAIATKTYELKDSNRPDSEKLRQFLRAGFRESPGPLTRIAYGSEGKDQIFHNWRTSDQYTIEDEIIGPEGWTHKIPDKKILESLLGTQDVSKVNEISQWINSAYCYIVRLNPKPKQRDERVVRFLVTGPIFFLGCVSNPLNKHPAFRVLQVE